MTSSEYVTGWSLDLGTDRRTGRPMERRTPHAVPAADAARGELPVRAECGAEVQKVTERPFSATPTMAAMAPCSECVGLVGRR